MFVAMIVLTLGISAMAADAPSKLTGEPLFSFVQITDSHIKADNARNSGYLQRTIARVNELNPDFVIITGDLTEQGTPEEYVELKKVLAELKPKLYTVAGNHELQKGTLASYEKEMGKPYQTFTHKDVAFFLLNNTMRNDKGKSMHHSKLDDEQMVWLQKELEAAKTAGAKQIIMAAHMPVSTKMGSYNTQRLDADTFLPLLEQYEVTAHISGHRHLQAISDEYKTLHIMAEKTWSRQIATEYKVYENGVQIYRLAGKKPAVLIAEKVKGAHGFPHALDAATKGEIAKVGHYSISSTKRKTKVRAESLLYRGMPIMALPLSQNLGFKTWVAGTPFTVKDVEGGKLVTIQYPTEAANIVTEVLLKEDGALITVKIDGFKAEGKNGYYGWDHPHHIIRGSNFKYTVKGEENTMDFPRYDSVPEIRYIESFEADTLYGFKLAVDWTEQTIDGVDGLTYARMRAHHDRPGVSMAVGYWQYTPDSKLAVSIKVKCTPLEAAE